MAPEGRLYETIAEALGPQAASASAPAATAPRTAESRAPFQCQKCGGAFVLIYESASEEGEEATVPAACPHCWDVNRVPAARSVAETRDYRVEKA